MLYCKFYICVGKNLLMRIVTLWHAILRALKLITEALTIKLDRRNLLYARAQFF